MADWGAKRAARDLDGNPIKVPADMTYAQWKAKYVDKPAERGIMSDRGMANGLRRDYHLPLADSEKEFILREIQAIDADPSVFVFRDFSPTGYSDKRDKVYVSSSVFPSADGSVHPTDLLSVRAALAHEYYGHRRYRNTKLRPGAWNDEFRASYMAAKTCPNLSDADRAALIRDALYRAQSAGVSVKLNPFMRRCLYGID